MSSRLFASCEAQSPGMMIMTFLRYSWSTVQGKFVRPQSCLHSFSVFAVHSLSGEHLTHPDLAHVVLAIGVCFGSQLPWVWVKKKKKKEKTNG